MKLIEFATHDFNEENNHSVILLNIEEIQSFKKTLDTHVTEVNLIGGQKNYLAGNYKTITNRYFYTLTKKHNLYEDDIIRPSIRVFHKNELLEPDISFLDSYQLKAFIAGLVDLCPEKQSENLKSIMDKINIHPKP